MGLELKKSKGTGGIPVFQKVLETARGGFTLDKSGMTAGSVLKAGTPITFNEATRIAKVANVDGSDVGGLLYEDTVVGGNTFVSVVTRGTVYENRIGEVADKVKKALPLIIFSKSF